jgi:nucleoside-diphosphate kinase
MERTLIILKPDAVERRMMGEIIGRFERKGLKVVGMKFGTAPREVVEKHYAEHEEKPFFGEVVGFMSGGPTCVLALEGNRAIEVCRRLTGKTKAFEAEPGTIRGDLGLSGQFNLVHGSDSPESAERELTLWFKPGELVSYELPDEKWVAE